MWVGVTGTRMAEVRKRYAGGLLVGDAPAYLPTHHCLLQAMGAGAGTSGIAYLILPAVAPDTTSARMKLLSQKGTHQAASPTAVARRLASSPFTGDRGQRDCIFAVSTFTAIRGRKIASPSCHCATFAGVGGQKDRIFVVPTSPSSQTRGFLSFVPPFPHSPASVARRVPPH